MTLSIIHDLDNLTEKEKKDYAAAVSAHLGLPPELNGLDFIWMENNGLRKLVLYARRGTTDILRDKHKISITSLTQKEVAGSLVTTVSGTDINGRGEFAVGSSHIAGLKGKALDDAIMTSQTRAMRRLTLQFVGGGILDESETTNAPTININSTTALESLVPAQPTVAINNNPGTEVAPAVAAQPPSQTDYSEQFVGQPEKIKEAWAQVKAKDDARLAAIAQLNAAAPETEKPVESTTRRKGGRPVGSRNKKPVDLGPSTPPVIAPLPFEQAAEAVAKVADGPALGPIAPTLPVAEPVTVPLPMPATVPVAKSLLTQEEFKQIKERRFAIQNTLEENGFTPSEGVSNFEKMRRLAALMFPGVTNFNTLTMPQWDKYLFTLEGKIKNEGPKATIQYIEEQIQ